VFADKTRDEWATLFEGSDACVAPVLDFEEAANYPHNIAREAFYECEGVTQAIAAPRFSRSHPVRPRPANETGVEGRQILIGAGYTQSEIASLENDGVLV